MYKQKFEQIKNDFPNIMPSIKKLLENQSNDFLSSTIKPPPIITECQFIKGQKTDEIDFYKTVFFESDDILIFAFFTLEETNNTNVVRTKVNITYFQKKNGQDFNNPIATIKGKAICAKFCYMYNYKETDKCALTLIIGVDHGSLKILSFGQIFEFEVYKLHTVAIKDISIAQKNQVYDYQNLALILSVDQTVFLINYSKKIIIAQFSDGRIPFQIPLSIQFHKTHKYFLQVYENGCLKLWEITTQLIDKINESITLPKDKFLKKYYTVIPMYSFHSAALDGILAAQFYGSFIILITKKNDLKMIAIDFSMTQSYLIILQHHIEGHEVTQMQIIENSEYILIAQKQNLTKIKFQQSYIVKIKQYKFDMIQKINWFCLSADQHFIAILSDNRFLVDRQRHSFRDPKVKNPKQSNQY